VAAAALAGSIALLGFGFDSFIESASALFIVWRTLAERRARDSAHVKAIELRASKLVAGNGDAGYEQQLSAGSYDCGMAVVVAACAAPEIEWKETSTTAGTDCVITILAGPVVLAEPCIVAVPAAPFELLP
jgi:hypothetical protein